MWPNNTEMPCVGCNDGNVVERSSPALNVGMPGGIARNNEGSSRQRAFSCSTTPTRFFLTISSALAPSSPFTNAMTLIIIVPELSPLVRLQVHQQSSEFSAG